MSVVFYYLRHEFKPQDTGKREYKKTVLQGTQSLKDR